MENAASDPASINSSTVKMKRRRDAARPPTPRQSFRAGRNIRVPDIFGQFTFEFVVDVPSAGLSQHTRGEVSPDQSARIRRDKRSTQPGAASGIEHIEARWTPVQNRTA